MEMIHNYICRDCAEKHGAVVNIGHACTVHKDKCKYCNTVQWLAHLSDWDWPEKRELEKGREI